MFLLSLPIFSPSVPMHLFFPDSVNQVVLLLTSEPCLKSFVSAPLLYCRGAFYISFSKSLITNIHISFLVLPLQQFRIHFFLTDVGSSSFSAVCVRLIPGLAWPAAYFLEGSVF